ncbi:MAG: hypothetical protein ACLP5V_02015 [Candidatus Bathyarchaeia archaeon]
MNRIVPELVVIEKEKTVTSSFRIRESAFKALEEDTARKFVSVNTTVNRLFPTYANLDRFFDRIKGFRKISLSERSILIEL